jgi:cysteine desulfurase
VPIYLDHNATTPVDPAVADAMDGALREDYGNASSVHGWGQRAKARLDVARASVAALVGGEPTEVVLTGSGTEADVLAVRGAAEALEAAGRRHLVVSTIEHEAVLQTVRALARRGWEVSWLGVDRSGVTAPEALAALVTDRTALVSVMLANNEVGTLQPIAEVAAVVRGHRGILLHVDAVQAAPWVDLDVSTLGADLVALSAHKAEGPKGTGALWIRRGTHLLAQEHGGTQERHRRAGTENVTGAVGMARAFELAVAERGPAVRRVRAQRDRLLDALLEIDGVEATGHPTDRLPHLASVIVRGLDGASATLGLDLEGIAVSNGSACTSGSADPSHVLTAMGYPADEARGAVRLSLGRTTTDAEIDEAVRVVPAVLRRLLEAAPAPREAVAR